MSFHILKDFKENFFTKLISCCHSNKMSAMHWEARRKQYVINKAHDVREKWSKEKHETKTLGKK